MRIAMALYICLDFDGTITQSDTTDTLVRLAIHERASNQTQGLLSRASTVISEDELLGKWDRTVSSYFQECDTHVKSYTPVENTWEEEGSYLESLRPLEMGSLQKVWSSGFFTGLTKEDLRRVGQKAFGRDGRTSRTEGEEIGTISHVSLRRGYAEFLGHVVSQDWLLGLVSVNWSKSFIEGVLDLSGDGSPFSHMLVNEPSEAGEIQGPEELGFRPIVTAKDKLAGFKHLKSKGKVSGRTVYIGDSMTDLLCLRSADLGIVIVDGDMAQNNTSKVIQTVKRITKQDVPHVSEARDSSMYWARDFGDILDSQALHKLSQSSP